MYAIDLHENSIRKIRCSKELKEKDGGSLVVHNGKAVLFGGSTRGIFSNEVWVMELGGFTWKKIEVRGCSPDPREMHSSHVIKDKMVVLGGTDRNSIFSDVFLLDLNKFQWKRKEILGDKFDPRYAMSSAVCENKIYVFGGMVLHNNKQEYSNDLFSIAISYKQVICEKFEIEGPQPAARSFSSLSTLNKTYLILFGGEHCNKPMNDLHLYDFSLNKWSEIFPINEISSRMGHTACCFNNTLIIFGGLSECQVVLSDISILSFLETTRYERIEKSINANIKPVSILKSSGNPTIIPQIPEHLTENLQSFLKLYSEIPYPTDWIINIPYSLHAAMAISEFEDPFSALLRIIELTPSNTVQCEMCGIVKYNGDILTKLFPSPVPVDFSMLSKNPKDKEFHIRQKLLKSWECSQLTPASVVKITFQAYLSPLNVYGMLSNLSHNSLLPAFFKISDRVLITCRNQDYFTIALAKYSSQDGIRLFFVVFDSSGGLAYPRNEQMHAVISNIYAQTHLSSIDAIDNANRVNIYLYAKELQEVSMDIFDKFGNSFRGLAENTVGKELVINGMRVITKKNISDFFEVNGKVKIYLVDSLDFWIIMYVCDRLVYWEYKDRQDMRRIECFTLEINDSHMISEHTGLLKSTDETREIIHRYRTQIREGMS